MKFQEFVKKVDERQIDSLYDKSHIAVELVNWYNPHILDNISTIANLQSNAFGLYNSGENQRLLSPDIEQRLIYYGKVNKQKLPLIPKVTLLKYFPELNPQNIKDSGVVKVNVRKIIENSQSDLEIVLQIAATIIHECTHFNDHQVGQEKQVNFSLGEESALAAERKFFQWAQTNLTKILQKYSILQGNVNIGNLKSYAH